MESLWLRIPQGTSDELRTLLDVVPDEVERLGLVCLMFMKESIISQPWFSEFGEKKVHLLFMNVELWNNHIEPWKAYDFVFLSVLPINNAHGCCTRWSRKTWTRLPYVHERINNFSTMIFGVRWKECSFVIYESKICVIAILTRGKTMTSFSSGYLRWILHHIGSCIRWSRKTLTRLPLYMKESIISQPWFSEFGEKKVHLWFMNRWFVE